MSQNLNQGQRLTRLNSKDGFDRKLSFSALQDRKSSKKSSINTNNAATSPAVIHATATAPVALSQSKMLLENRKSVGSREARPSAGESSVISNSNNVFNNGRKESKSSFQGKRELSEGGGSDSIKKRESITKTIGDSKPPWRNPSTNNYKLTDDWEKKVYGPPVPLSALPKESNTFFGGGGGGSLSRSRGYGSTQQQPERGSFPDDRKDSYGRLSRKRSSSNRFDLNPANGGSIDNRRSSNNLSKKRSSTNKLRSSSRHHHRHKKGSSRNKSPSRMAQEDDCDDDQDDYDDDDCEVPAPPPIQQYVMRAPTTNGSFNYSYPPPQQQLQQQQFSMPQPLEQQYYIPQQEPPQQQRYFYPMMMPEQPQQPEQSFIPPQEQQQQQQRYISPEPQQQRYFAQVVPQQQYCRPPPPPTQLPILYARPQKYRESLIAQEEECSSVSQEDDCEPEEEEDDCKTPEEEDCLPSSRYQNSYHQNPCREQEFCRSSQRSQTSEKFKQQSCQRKPSYGTQVATGPYCCPYSCYCVQKSVDNDDDCGVPSSDCYSLLPRGNVKPAPVSDFSKCDRNGNGRYRICEELSSSRPPCFCCVHPSLPPTCYDHNKDFQECLDKQKSSTCYKRSKRLGCCRPSRTSKKSSGVKKIFQCFDTNELYKQLKELSCNNLESVALVCRPKKPQWGINNHNNCNSGARPRKSIYRLKGCGENLNIRGTPINHCCFPSMTKLETRRELQTPVNTLFREKELCRMRRLCCEPKPVCFSPSAEKCDAETQKDFCKCQCRPQLQQPQRPQIPEEEECVRRQVRKISTTTNRYLTTDKSLSRPTKDRGCSVIRLTECAENKNQACDDYYNPTRMGTQTCMDTGTQWMQAACPLQGQGNLMAAVKTNNCNDEFACRSHHQQQQCLKPQIQSVCPANFAPGQMQGGQATDECMTTPGLMIPTFGNGYQSGQGIIMPGYNPTTPIHPQPNLFDHPCPVPRVWNREEYKI